MTVDVWVLLKTFYTKNTIEKRSIVSYDTDLHKELGMLRLYKEYLKKQPDPYFGNINELHGRNISGGVIMWDNNGKKIKLKIYKITVTV
jgi:hypothetical protein